MTQIHFISAAPCTPAHIFCSVTLIHSGLGRKAVRSSGQSTRQKLEKDVEEKYVQHIPSMTQIPTVQRLKGNPGFQSLSVVGSPASDEHAQ